jgi:Glycosyl transferases group 1
LHFPPGEIMVVAENQNQVWLVEEQRNPSTDFYLMPALQVAGCPIVRCAHSDPVPEELPDGATVIFVRYIPRPWMKLVKRSRKQLARLAYFMDDDLLDTRATAGLPIAYRFKLARLAAGRADWLRRQQAEIWVSTVYLRDKYADWNPRMVLPAAAYSGTERQCRVFYHGSASHEAELRWLKQVMQEVLQRDEDISFEIIGDEAVRKLYQGLPRVSVLRPMKWPAYRALLALQGRHIGLAPMLDTAFNRARSHTKFFDITHAGAVGIYSAGTACAAVVKHEVEGLVLRTDPSAWAEAILRLAREESLRTSLLQNARLRMEELSGEALRFNRDMLQGERARQPEPT